MPFSLDFVGILNTASESCHFKLSFNWQYREAGTSVAEE